MQTASTTPYDKVKVLVLGDAGVGKSSLVHMLCHNEPLKGPMATVGCNVDAKIHHTPPSIHRTGSSAGSNGISAPQYRGASSSSAPGPMFVEFYDVSGSPSRHPKSRSMFYNISYNGIILVYDVCNKRSHANLWKWLAEYQEAYQQTKQTLGGGSGASSGDQSPALGVGYPDFRGIGNDFYHKCPVMVVGTKVDLLSEQSYDQETSAPGRRHSITKEYGGESVSLCTLLPSDFMPNSAAHIAFSMFFSKVVDKKLHRTHQLPSTPITPTVASPYGNQMSSPSSTIPTVDFATFTGSGSSRPSVTGVTSPSDGTYSSGHSGWRHDAGTTATINNVQTSPSTIPGRPTTPSQSPSIQYKNRAPLYDRHRPILGTTGGMGVPIYTHTRTATGGASSTSSTNDRRV